MKKALEKILKLLAILTIKRYKPKVIAITGNVGKTSTKDAVFEVLSKKQKARKSQKSYNNEIGVPVAILGIKAENNIFLWFFYLALSVFKLIYTRYPKILVLEYGVDKPNDMDYLLEIAVPDIAVVTALGDIPVHLENFSSPSELVREKTKLPKAVKKEGKVVLNADFPLVEQMKEKTKAKVFMYGFSSFADFKILDPEIKFSQINEVNVPSGTSFKVEYKGSIVPVRINEFGIPNVYAAACACFLGVLNGMNLVEASEAVSSYKAPKGRMNLIFGAKDTFILDDSYNASPSSMIASLETFKKIPAKRKVAVLGDMLEIGKYSEEAHRSCAKLAASFCDVIIAVGTKSLFVVDEAQKHGFEKGENLFYFETSEKLSEKIYDLIQKGDFILFKGSQGVRLEKAIKEILKDKRNADKFLVRQSKKWLKKN